VFGERGGDAHHMATALLFHLGNSRLRDMEEAIEIGRQCLDVVIHCESGKRLGGEDACVVDQCIDTTETVHRFLHDALGDVAVHRHDVRIARRFDGT
jgi:hypothetical protein